MLYSAPTIPSTRHPKEKESIYVDDDTILQGATTPKLATIRLHGRLADRISSAQPLGLSYTTTKKELIHLHSTSSNRLPHTQSTITFNNPQMTNSLKIHLLWLASITNSPSENTEALPSAKSSKSCPSSNEWPSPEDPNNVPPPPHNHATCHHPAMGLRSIVDGGHPHP